MSKAWPTVRLGEVTAQVQRAEVPLPGTTYRQIGVKLWGVGAYEREVMDGSQTKYGQLFRAEADDIIVNKIWARNGSVAVVPPSLAGCFGSGEFPMFAPNKERLDPHWMHWLTKTPGFWNQCDEKSRGTSGKNRIRPEQFLNIEVPLPPLAEQRRVVARIEELTGQIQEARGQREQTAKEGEALLQNSVARVIGAGWPTTPLERAVDPERQITYGIVQAGDHIPDGVPYIRVSDMAKPRLTTAGMLRTSTEIATRYRRSAVREGDIVFAIRATIGKMRFVPKELDGANLTQGTARIAPSEKALAPYLYWALQSRDVATSIQAATKGSTFKEITLGRLRTISVPLPPLPEQHRIVAELDALQAEVDAVTKLQAETAAELDALLPAILDRAFKGELV